MQRIGAIFTEEMTFELALKDGLNFLLRGTGILGIRKHWKCFYKLLYSLFSTHNKILQSGLNNRNLFLTVLEAEIPRPKCWKVWFFQRQVVGLF